VQCRKTSRRLAISLTGAAALSACTAGLREPAATLAGAGVTATTALSTDHHRKADQLRSLDAFEAFSRTYEFCASAHVTCSPQLSSRGVSEERAGLARAIMLRAQAVEALGDAYQALQAEAAYDARGDIEDAANKAISAVNSYAAAVAAIPASQAAPLVSEPVQRLIGFGAGLLGARAQDRRIVNDSRKIRVATSRMRNALDREAYVFDSLTDYMGQLQTAAVLDMLDSGLTPADAGLKPLLEELGLPQSKNSESLVSNSPRLKMSLAASLTARSKANVFKTQQAYRAAIGALNELIKAHDDLEAKRPLSLAVLNARVAELNQLLAEETRK
jgi:hypothetical protein